MGTILGGSSIVCPSKGKNCYLSMRDSRKDWLETKAGELGVLASEHPFTLETTFRWHSKCYPVLQEFRQLFYRDGKRFVTTDTLSLLGDVSFAMWVGDCGKMQGKQLLLNTHIWGESNKAIAKYFKILGYHPEILQQSNKTRILLDINGTNDFLKYATPHLPEWLTI